MAGGIVQEGIVTLKAAGTIRGRARPSASSPAFRTLRSWGDMYEQFSHVTSSGISKRERWEGRTMPYPYQKAKYCPRIRRLPTFGSVS